MISLSTSSPSRFPDPRQADENGIVAIGGDLKPETLIDAYSHGIFPWPHKNYPLLWFSPEERGLLFFEELHMSRSLLKSLKKTNFKASFNREFEKVIENCAAKKRPGQNDTWVTDDMKAAYLEMHRRGLAHSVECWNGEQLVGGLYGVYIGGVFSAESMYFAESGASKFCFLTLIHRLSKRGHTFLDTQMITPVVESFGGRYVPRDEYLRLLSQAQAKKIPWTTLHQ